MRIDRLELTQFKWGMSHSLFSRLNHVSLNWRKILENFHWNVISNSRISINFQRLISRIYRFSRALVSVDGAKKCHNRAKPLPKISESRKLWIKIEYFKLINSTILSWSATRIVQIKIFKLWIRIETSWILKRLNGKIEYRNQENLK